VRERVLQWAWNKRLIQGNVEANHSIRIHSTGTWNLHQPGPDFLNAILEINGIIWHGSVEIHLNSSDWYKHRHHLDTNYTNVILHVVVNNDEPAFINGQKIPTLIVDSTVVRWLNVLKDPTNKALPCSNLHQSFTDATLFKFWTKRILRKKKERGNSLILANYLLDTNLILPAITLNSRQRTYPRYLESILKAKQHIIKKNELELIPIKLPYIREVLCHSGMTFFEIQHLLLNGFVPLLWKVENSMYLREYCQTLPAESNVILKKFKRSGNFPKNAFESQAFLEIYKQLCTNTVCLKCELGKFIFRA